MNAVDSQEGPDLSSVPLVGVAVNSALAMLKIVTGVFGNSYALIADGIESTSDIVTSLVVWGGLRVAQRPADERHPYGYGKAESLAGVVAAVALLLAAGIIAWQSIKEIQSPHHLPHWSTLIVLASVVLIKETMARWVAFQGRSVESTALQGDAWHHRSDALTSIAAFIGIGIGLWGGPGYEAADDIAALFACAVILFSGLRLLTMSVRETLDMSPGQEFERKVREVAIGIEGVQGIEKCRIRKSGIRYFVEIHVEVDGSISVDQAHRIGGKVRAALRSSTLRIADALIHMEPYTATVE